MYSLCLTKPTMKYVARSDYPQTLSYVLEGRNFIITRTFSKIYGLAGLRIGYGIAPPPLVETLNRVRQPFNCSLVGQAAARAALKDTDHVTKSQKSNTAGKAFLYKAFDDMGLRYIQTEGNFIMLHVPQPGGDITDALLRQGVIVRPMAGYGYPNAVRVTNRYTAGKRKTYYRFKSGQLITIKNMKELIQLTNKRPTRQIMVGNVPIGGDSPISIQTMTTTLTHDVDATLAQVERCAEAGAQIVPRRCP